MAQQASKVTCKQTKATAIYNIMQEANKLITVLVHVCIRHVHTEGFPWLLVDTFRIRLHYAPSCPSRKQVKRQDDAHADSSTRQVIVLAHSASLTMLRGSDSRMKDQIYKHSTTR